MDDNRHVVMVRGDSDVVANLVLVSDCDDMIEVGSLDLSATIRVPSVDVFEFDSTLFNEIRGALDSGDREHARLAWGRAKHLERPAA